MLIASRSKEQIINTDSVCHIFIGTDNHKIIALAQNNKSIVVDTYEKIQDAGTAMEMLTERIRIATRDTTICFMPTEQEILAYRNSKHQEKSRSMDGSKQKGHGGS